VRSFSDGNLVLTLLQMDGVSENLGRGDNHVQEEKLVARNLIHGISG
jgi:hypothetical protein